MLSMVASVITHLKDLRIHQKFLRQIMMHNINKMMDVQDVEPEVFSGVGHPIDLVVTVEIVAEVVVELEGMLEEQLYNDVLLKPTCSIKTAWRPQLLLLFLAHHHLEEVDVDRN
jgi:hypothetical protein